MSKSPDCLESTSYKDPGDSARSLFRYATQIDMDSFDWLHTQPRELDMFSAAMVALSAYQNGTMNAKVSTLFTADISEHQVVMVDV